MMNKVYVNKREREPECGSLVFVFVCFVGLFVLSEYVFLYGHAQPHTHTRLDKML